LTAKIKLEPTHVGCYKVRGASLGFNGFGLIVCRWRVMCCGWFRSERDTTAVHWGSCTWHRWEPLWKL